MSGYAEFILDLPSGTSVEVDCPDGTLRVGIEVVDSPRALAELSDALRAAVVDVDARRHRTVPSPFAVAEEDEP